MSSVKFVVELWSVELGCVVDQVNFVAPSATQLAYLLGLSGMDEACAYELEAADLKLLEPLIGKPLTEGDLRPVLRMHYWLDDLSYRVHTGRELLMLLEGLKPLAAFAGACPCTESSDDLPERYFLPYVNAGRLICRESIEPSKDENVSGIRHVLYALPNHEWRIEAYLLMLRIGEIEGWSDALERMQGSLLGYEDWQNDEFMTQLRARRRSAN